MKCKIEFELPDILRNSIETDFVDWKFKGFSGWAKATRVLQPEQKFFVDSDGKITPLPVQKHGHWIRSPKFLPETQCSVCKNTYVGDCREFKFCPECGAMMDEEVKQDD